MTTTPRHESLWQLSQDVSIKNKLRDFRNILDTLAKNNKITLTEKDEFTREWLWTDPDKIDERGNGLVDKYIQELIKTAQEKGFEKDETRRAVISKLDAFKTVSSNSPAVKKSLGLRDDAPMVEVLRKATDELRANVDERKKDTASAQVTPAKSAPSPAQEAKPKTENQTPPVPVAEPVTPAPVQAPVLIKTPPVLPAHEKTKPVDKPALAPKVIPVIEPSDIKQRPASIQKPAPVEVQTTTPNLEIPSTNVKREWVKESLQWHFKDIKNPTKNEIKKVLEEFKDKVFDKNKKTPEWSARAIFAIQAALGAVWIKVGIDGIYGDNTRLALQRFQKEQMGFNGANGHPGPKTIKALLDQL